MKKFILGFFIVCLLTLNNAYAKVLADIPAHPQRALIIIHGYGGDGAHMSWMTNTLKNSLPNMAFYYPTAPDKSPRGGYQWFKIPAMGDDMSKKDMYDAMMADAMGNLKELHKLVEEIHDELGLPYQNIYVAGFSQGGLMALLTALTNPHPLQVAVSFSGVPLLFTKDFMPAHIKNSPDILIMQGDSDQVIPENSLEMTALTLAKLKIEPQINVLKGVGHQINQDAINTAIEFME